MDVAIVTVGDELLSGDTVNTNAAWLCARLAERGVGIERVVTVPDRIADIARVINEYHAEYDAVIVTGGLGPTHDDLTMEGVAAAFGRTVEPHDAAIEWLTEHGGYSAEALTEGTTALPSGAEMIPNDEGVAPGAILGAVYVLPGVPAEMKAMFERITDNFSGDPVYTEFVRTPEPESTLVERFETVRERFAVTVGSYPGDHVRVKFSGADADEVAAAAAWFRERVDVLEE
ncbi:competence/damage-inducible protein A [Haloferacaceae archaeon DSL9]